MNIDPKIFKAYDIRGLAPEQVTEEVGYRVGQIMVKFTGAKTVAVGRDMRDTSPALFRAVVDGVMSQGADVVDIGLVATPMFYYGVGANEDHEAGIMVTASHNPSEYNGMKLCHGNVAPIGSGSGMEEIRDMALDGRLPEAAKKGSMRTLDIRQGFLDKVFSIVDPRSLKPMKVVIDTANGMEGVIIEDVIKRMPQVEFHTMFLELDGRFPNHEANPLKEETLDQLKAKIKEIGADLGIAYDGDGDRIGIVDENGETVRGDMITALLAPLMLEKESEGTPVLYDVRESMVVAEEIGKAGGKAMMSRVGHGLIKPQMREVGAVFAGELSNHFYFRDFYVAEASDWVMLLFMELMTKTGKPLSELVAPLKRYHHSGEINSEVEDKQGMMDGLEDMYGKYAKAVTKIDGIRLDFDGDDGKWWFNVRPSNTEPLLRLNLEAETKETMETKREELLAIIRG